MKTWREEEEEDEETGRRRSRRNEEVKEEESFFRSVTLGVMCLLPPLVSRRLSCGSAAGLVLLVLAVSPEVLRLFHLRPPALVQDQLHGLNGAEKKSLTEEIRYGGDLQRPQQDAEGQYCLFFSLRLDADTQRAVECQSITSRGAKWYYTLCR